MFSDNNRRLYRGRGRANISKLTETPLHVAFDNFDRTNDNITSPSSLADASCKLAPSNSDGNTNSPLAATIQINLPKFWEQECMLWFLTVETLFNLKQITSEKQKLELILAALDMRHMRRLEFVLSSLDYTRPYSQVKRHCVKFLPPQRKSVSMSCYIEPHSPLN